MSNQPKTTTFREVFERLPADIKERAIANTHPLALDRPQPVPLHFGEAFFWKSTPEKNEFWWAVNRTFYGGLDTPIPECNVPKRIGKAIQNRTSKHIKINQSCSKPKL